MRYFEYISDAKVEMLLPQVPDLHRKRIATKFGVDIKIFSGSLETERSTLDSRIARLEAVESYIREAEAVGTPEEPQTWIAGAAEGSVVHVGEGAIMYVCHTPGWVLALGGSEHHLIGAVRRDDLYVGYSFLPTLIDLLKRMDSMRGEPALMLPDDAVPGYWTAGLGSGFDAWRAVIQEACHQVTAPPQRLTFLARRLLSHRESLGRLLTLATPLYVALGDD